MARAQPLFQMALWPSGLEFFVHIHVGSGRIDVLHRSSGCICVPSAFWLMHNQHCSIPDRTDSCSRSQVFMWYQRVKRYDWLQVICTGQVDQFVLQPVISWRYLLVVMGYVGSWTTTVASLLTQRILVQETMFFVSYQSVKLEDWLSMLSTDQGVNLCSLSHDWVTLRIVIWVFFG